MGANESSVAPPTFLGNPFKTAAALACVFAAVCIVCTVCLFGARVSEYNYWVFLVFERGIEGVRTRD